MARRPGEERRLIESEADLRAGVRALRRKCPLIRRAHDFAGDPPLRRRAAGLEGLARIVVAQQVSVASANAIWSRFEAAVSPLSPATLLAASDEQLRGAGLSRPKMRTLRALAAAIEGGLALERLPHVSDAEVHEALTAVSGIGPWTADIYLMFCLGRADAFAAGDLALQSAVQIARGSKDRPDAAALLEIAETWRPWRGVAARVLWSYYGVAKSTRPVVPV